MAKFNFKLVGTKSRIVKFRINRFDYACLFNKAAEEGLTISEYIRRLIIKNCK